MDLRISAWAAVVSAVLVIPISIIGIMRALLPENASLAQTLVPLTFLTSVIGIIVALGFLKIAEKKKLIYMKNMVLISIAFILIIAAFSMVDLESSITAIILLITLGVIQILLGTSFMSLKRYYGKPATALSILFIIEGFFTITLVLYILTPITSLVTSILEAVILFKAAKKIR